MLENEFGVFLVLTVEPLSGALCFTKTSCYFCSSTVLKTDFKSSLWFTFSGPAKENGAGTSTWNTQFMKIFLVHPIVTRLTISIGNRKFSAMWKSCVLIELLQMYMCSEDGAGIQHSSGFCENILSDVRNFERFSLAHFTDAMENTNLWIFHRQKNH